MDDSVFAAIRAIAQSTQEWVKSSIERAKAEQVRIGKRDPNTGRYEVIYPDGSSVPGGVKTFNSEVTNGSFVRGVQALGSQVVALDYKSVFYEEEVLPVVEEEEEEVVTYGLKILYQQIVDGTHYWYVGGHTEEPVLVPGITNDISNNAFTIFLQNTGPGVNDWKVYFSLGGGTVVGSAQSTALYVATHEGLSSADSDTIATPAEFVGFEEDFISQTNFFKPVGGGFWTRNETISPDYVITALELSPTEEEGTLTGPARDYYVVDLAFEESTVGTATYNTSGQVNYESYMRVLPGVTEKVNYAGDTVNEDFWVIYGITPDSEYSVYCREQDNGSTSTSSLYLYSAESSSEIAINISGLTNNAEQEWFTWSRDFDSRIMLYYADRKLCRSLVDTTFYCLRRDTSSSVLQALKAATTVNLDAFIIDPSTGVMTKEVIEVPIFQITESTDSNTTILYGSYYPTEE